MNKRKPQSGKHGNRRGIVDQKTRARIMDLLRAGELSRNAIAHEVGVSPSTVSRFARAAEIPLRPAPARGIEAAALDTERRRDARGC